VFQNATAKQRQVLQANAISPAESQIGTHRILNSQLARDDALKRKNPKFHLLSKSAENKLHILGSLPNSFVSACHRPDGASKATQRPSGAVNTATGIKGIAAATSRHPEFRAGVLPLRIQHKSP
jgi:hypothetical protein